MSLELSKTAKLLRKLIQIPSVSPDDNPGTDQVGEEQLGEFLCAYFRKLGATVKLTEVTKGRPNFHAIFPSSGKPRLKVLFVPHLDTVSVADMTIDPFSAEVHDGKIWGRGASDTKGPMAAMITALEEHLKSNRDSLVEWHFAATMGEETGCIGAGHFAKTCPRYDLVIAGEPTQNKIVHAHKGCLWLEITAKGKSRHASIASIEDNAAFTLSPLLAYLQGEAQAWLKPFEHPVLGSPSLQVTRLQAGTKTNISPASASLIIDMRTVPGLDSRLFLKELKKQPFWNNQLKHQILVEARALNTDPTHKIVQGILPATKGLDIAPWFCDASVFAQRGIPSIALGPGSIKQAHTKDEFISLAELNRGNQTYLRVMKRLQAQSKE
ncbi:MAG: M20 family metallopeptidase [Verrucomicrobiota bacterium]